MKNFIKFTLLGIAALFVIVLLVATLAPPEQKEAEPKTTTPAKPVKEAKAEPAAADPIPPEDFMPGKKEYEQIKTGMNMNQVKSILGLPSSESETEIAGKKYATMMFNAKGDIGAMITLTIANNEVNSKSQFGIK